MSGLYSQLSIGSSAILAQGTGVSAAGHNIANVNTAGHTRVDADLRSQTGGLLGVQALGFSSTADAILASRERVADGQLGHAQDLQAATLDLEAGISPEAANMVDAIAALFGGITELASTPTDISMREGAVSRAQELSSSLRRTAQAVMDSRGAADRRIQGLAQQANALSAEISNANRELLKAPDPALNDRRNQAARELSTLVGGRAHLDARGSMRFAMENGAVLVDGDRASALQATADPAYSGLSRLDVVDGNYRRDVTQTLTSGRIGAQLQFREQTAAQTLTDLDQLAYDLSTQMNAVHQGFAGMDGVSGRDLFVPPTQVQGAALVFAVESQIVADPGRFASSDPNLGSGDNSGLLALANLQDAALAGGSSRSFAEEGLRMMSSLGFTVQRAQQDQQVAALRSDSLASFRDSISGVSVEEELTKLQAFQRATEASARVISTVDSLLGTLIQSV